LLRIDVIVLAGVVGVWFSRWWWAAIAAVVLAFVKYALLLGSLRIIWPKAPGAKLSTNPEIYAIDFSATAIAFVIWAMIFFLLKKSIMRSLKWMRRDA
jgi:branched-subunit amino acid permease